MRPTTSIVGSVIYWVIHIFDSDGLLIDADSTPTVVVRKNGIATIDSVTITKRSATTGIYDCEYNPAAEVEGDKFTFEETVVIDTVSYANDPWSLTILANVPSASTTAQAVRTELTDELDIINNIPDSFDAISTQIDDISTVVYVSPAAFTSPGKITGRSLRPYYKDTSRLGPIGIADSTKTPIDLSPFDGDLYVSVMDSDTLEVLLYDDDPYFVTSNLYIDPSPESVGVLNAPLCWALRRISNDQTLMEGPWEVQFAAYGTE